MTFAQIVGGSDTGIVGLLNTVVIPFIGALMVFFFLWGVIKYFFFQNKGDPKGFKEGRDFVIWGIVGIVVFFSIWGILTLLLSTLGIQTG
jgi:hypothetical protein